MNYNKETSVIICTKNAENTISRVIEAAMLNNPKEIIVVDGNSDDKTQEIAKRYDIVIVTDPGKGLALARKIGVEKATGEYVFFIGPDNLVYPDTINKLVDYMHSNEYAGVALLTELEDARYSYWSYGMEKYWQSLVCEGEREVIGTPSLYKRYILQKHQFDTSMTFADDSDLGARLKAAGYRLGYSPYYCMEIGVNKRTDIKNRFRMYGISDYQYYARYSNNWSIRRKIKSFFHPIDVCLIKPFKKTKNLITIIKVLPFLLLITFWRYGGWISSKS